MSETTGWFFFTCSLKHRAFVVFVKRCHFTIFIEPHSVDLKGVGPGLMGVSERSTGEGHVGQLSRPRAFSQSAMHSLERGDRGNTQALAELAQVKKGKAARKEHLCYWDFI